MKLHLMLIFSLFTFSSASFSQTVGFHCPGLSLDIMKNAETISLENVKTQESKKFERIELPLGNDIDSYQTRVSIYYDIIQRSYSSFPYMPEFLMLYHVLRSGHLFKKGFQAMEGQGKAITLSKMYCKTLIKTLEQY